MRYYFDEELANVKEELQSTGDLCTEAVNNALLALTEGNEKKARKVFDQHWRINHQQRQIEDLCLKLLLRQQPVARDLRWISAVLKSVYDLARIGEMSADIADIILSENVSAANTLLPLKDMGDIAEKMVSWSIKALVEADCDLADQTIAMDDTVDKAFVTIKQTIAQRFNGQAKMEYALDLLMIAKYLEKIADHAVNIAGWAKFSVNGELPREIVRTAQP